MRGVKGVHQLGDTPKKFAKTLFRISFWPIYKKNTNWNFKTFNKYRSSVQTMMAVENRKTTILWSSNLGPGKTPGISKFQSLHTKPTDHPPLQLLPSNGEGYGSGGGGFSQRTDGVNQQVAEASHHRPRWFFRGIHPPNMEKKNISMARTIEFANWRISKNVLVFTKLEESSFYSITCFHQLVTKCWSLGEISSSTFCGRNSQWGFENLDPPKNLHKSLSNPPQKKMISLQSFLGRNSPRRRGVWFGFGGSLLKTNEAPHPSGTVKLELALFAWPTSERPAHTPALWWLIAWNPAVQYEQIYVNFTWGAPEFKTYRSKKKVTKLGSVWGANTICYKRPCLGWRPVLIGNKNSPYSRHNS